VIYSDRNEHISHWTEDREYETQLPRAPSIVHQASVLVRSSIRTHNRVSCSCNVKAKQMHALPSICKQCKLSTTTGDILIIILILTCICQDNHTIVDTTPSCSSRCTGSHLLTRKRTHIVFWQVWIAHFKTGIGLVCWKLAVKVKVRTLLKRLE